MMTPKGFLTKTGSTKAISSALGFIQAYREYLTTGEVASATSPIVARLDAGEVPASIALDEIKKAVLAHILEQDKIQVVEPKQVKETSSSKRSHPIKPFEARIVDPATGKICTRVTEKGEIEDLIKCFDQPQQAERWCDRRLFDGCVSWYGEIRHYEKPWDVINRDDSIARVLKRPLPPVSKSPKYGGTQLSWGMKCKQDHSSFSKG